MKKQILAFAILLFATPAVATGCGSAPGITGPGITAQGQASPEQTALLAIRTDVKSGLRYQRTVLGSYDLKAGMDADTLKLVAGRYRQLAENVVKRSRPISSLRDFGAEMDRAVKFERESLAGRPAAAATLAEVVGEYQGAFSRASATADARLGRRAPGEGEDDLVWNPHVGKSKSGDETGSAGQASRPDTSVQDRPQSGKKS